MTGSDKERRGERREDGRRERPSTKGRVLISVAQDSLLVCIRKDDGGRKFSSEPPHLVKTESSKMLALPGRKSEENVTIKSPDSIEDFVSENSPSDNLRASAKKPTKTESTTMI